MIFQRSALVLVMAVLFIGHSGKVQADCNTDWLLQNPPQGNLSGDQIAAADAVCDWLQTALPEYFAPHTESVTEGPLLYRFYSETNSFLGAWLSHELRFFYLGPLSGYCILDLGTVADWLPFVPLPIQAVITGEINHSAYNALQSTTSISLSRLCSSLEDFLTLQNEIAKTPQGSVVMMILAMGIYQQDAVLGRQCLSAASTSPLTSPSTAPGSYAGQIITNVSRLTENLGTNPRLPYIYFQGAAPTNNYTPEAPPYVLNMFTNMYSYSTGGDGLVRIKLFVQTLGADSARPATVKKVGDIYKVTEFSSLYLGYKPVHLIP